MRKFFLAFSFIALALSVSQCYKEPDFGHLKLYVTFPEAVVVPDEPVYFVPSPGEGASVNLFDKDAVCLGYKDARAGIAWLDDNYSGPKYSLGTDEHGMAVFENLMPGEYLLVVCTMKLYRYSERYIEVGGGDTLKLTKNFTPDLGYIDQLEPWDHQIPGYEY